MGHDSKITENDELIAGVAEFIGRGMSVWDIKRELQISMNYPDITQATVNQLMKNAYKYIVNQWDVPAAQFRGSILQGIKDQLKDDGTSRHLRSKLFGLMIKLAQQLPDQSMVPNLGDWAKLTPAQIAEQMDDATSSVPEDTKESSLKSE